MKVYKCIKTLGYTPIWSFCGIGRPSSSQRNARYRKRMLPRERTGKISQTFGVIKAREKKAEWCRQRIKKKQCQAIDFVIVYTGFLLKGRDPGASAAGSFWQNPQRKLFPPMHSFLGVLNISAYSQSIVAVEVAFLFAISSSINTKNKYFVQFWIANAGLLEVQGLPLSCSGANTYLRKRNTHTSST